MINDIQRRKDALIEQLDDGEITTREFVTALDQLYGEPAVKPECGRSTLGSDTIKAALIVMAAILLATGAFIYFSPLRTCARALNSNEGGVVASLCWRAGRIGI